MSISYIEALLVHTVHPQIVRTILYDHHMENRLNLLSDVEILVERDHGIDLSIQCDIESRTVVYEVEGMGFIMECSW
jgi:hypothetical protein